MTSFSRDLINSASKGLRINMNDLEKKEFKAEYQCYECGIYILVPKKFKKNSYILIQQHYMEAHAIDLYRFKADKKVGAGVGIPRNTRVEGDAPLT
jgi:hypothetical protein